MSLITRILPPDNKNAKLTFAEMDSNLYYLQSLGVSGITFSSSTLTLTNPTGGTKTVTINDYYTTGATYSNGLIYFNRNDQLSAYTANISSLTGDANTFITAVTYTSSANTITLTDNTNNSFNVYINSVSGLTVNGSLSATTLYGDGSNLTGISTQDTFVTGGTYSNGSAIFTNNTGGTFNVSGFYTGGTDVFVTGGTYSSSTITFTNNTGGTFNVTGISTQDTFVTGGTYSAGTITFTNNTGGTFNVSNILSGSIYSTTDNYTSGVTKTITHNLNTTNILLQLIDTINNELIYGTITNYQNNTVDVTLNQSLNNIKVVVVGVNNFQGSNNLPSCKISINGTSGLSNTNNGSDFLVLYNNNVYNSSPLDFVVSNSKIQIVNSGRYMIMARYSSYDMTDGTDFLRIGVISATTSSNGDLGSKIEYLDKGYIGTTVNGEASKSGSMVYIASGGEWIGILGFHGGASGGGGGNQGYPVFDNSFYNQPYLEIIKIGN